MAHTSTIGSAGQIRATSALLKFCRIHKHTPFFVAKLEECLAALEAKEGAKVLEIEALLSRGGMGSYLDWYPETVSEQEDSEYIETIWWSLNANWHRTLSSIARSA